MTFEVIYTALMQAMRSKALFLLAMLKHQNKAHGTSEGDDRLGLNGR